MKHYIFPFTLLLIVSLSCSSVETRNYEFVHSTTVYLERINFELIEENNITLAYLSTTYPKVDSIRNVRQRMLEYIESNSREIIELCGGYKNGKYQDPFSTKQVTSFFITDGNGIDIKNKINSEITGAEEMGFKVWKKFRDFKDFPEFKNDPNVENLTFHQVFFEDKYLYESIYALELFKNEILHSERRYLTSLLIKHNGK